MYRAFDGPPLQEPSVASHVTGLLARAPYAHEGVSVTGTKADVLDGRTTQRVSYYYCDRGRTANDPSAAKSVMKQGPYMHNQGFFENASAPGRGDFTVSPEWVSESKSVRRGPTTSSTGGLRYGSS